jgi:flavorubredoxin
MKELKLAEGIYWVGVVDWNVRNFHGYTTPRGSSYNAYLVIDEKIALIDTVKGPFCDELLDNVRKYVDPARIDYVVSNHAELDHSGSLPAVMAAAPGATLVASPKGHEALDLHYGGEWKKQTVKTGDSISLGKRTLEFTLTPMAHWPDSMFSYMPEEKILFSMDAFGQHIGSVERFDDELGKALVMNEARKYYANILMYLSRPVRNALNAAAGLDIAMLATSHGVIWRSYIGEIVEKYAQWAAGEASPRACIVYDTMWNSTEKLAKSLLQGLEEEGVPARVFHLGKSDLTEIASEILDCRGLLVGSSTLNNGMLPLVAGFLAYMRGLKPAGKKGAVFGSYGWSKGACKAMIADLEATGVDVTHPPLEVRYIPTADDLAKARKMGRDFARSML